MQASVHRRILIWVNWIFREKMAQKRNQMGMVKEKSEIEEISHGDVPQKDLGFQLTGEGKPSLGSLIEKLRENYVFFSGMDDREIVSILKLCGRRSYKPGQTIFKQGDTGNCFYMIVYGEVSIIRRDTELSRLGQGQCFGEMAVLEEQPRNASALATKPTLLFSLERNTLVNTLPSLGFKVASHLAKELSKKLRDMDEQAEK